MWCKALPGGREVSTPALASPTGTNVVAGVTPGRGGQLFEDQVPVFDTVEQALRETQANVSLIFVPPAFATDAIAEAAEALVPLIVCITEGIPVLDMVRLTPYLDSKQVRLVGPNCPGLISPGASCKVGIMPGSIHRPGRTGVISRSGTLTYEAVEQLSGLGIGPVQLRWHWRGPNNRHQLRGRPPAVQRGSRHGPGGTNR